MDRKERTDGFTEVEDRFTGYKVYDRDGHKIGKVDDLFLDEGDNLEYMGVKMGFFGLSSTLIPVDAVRVEEGQQALYVEAEKEHVKDGPRFDDDNEITPEFERQVREYYGLGAAEARGGYGAYDDDRDPDELSVRRSEEELRAGVRERKSGQVNVRKRVKTERESLTVPRKREEVSVDRVPVEDEAYESELGEDEVSVPVVEEEVVVEKRPVVKEEIRVRKDVVEDEEVVEEDVRKEEVDIDDGTTGRRRG